MSDSPFKHVEVDRRLRNQNGLNSFDDHTNAVRRQMNAGHSAQTVVINRPSQKIFLTGMEDRYGEQVFKNLIPVNATIRAVIPRYRARDDHMAAIRHDEDNPETLVIYVEEDTGIIDVMHMSQYFSGHPYFGYRQRAKNMDKIFVGSRIPAGTEFMTSPNIKPDGQYEHGITLNTAVFSHPAVIEDGFMFNKKRLNDVTTTTLKYRDVSWGADEFPLLMYPRADDPSYYGIFPELGSYVREDDILMAFRRDNPYTGWIDQSAKAVREIHAFGDRRVYSGGGGILPGRVVDIKIYRDEYRVSELPEQMDMQVLRYYDDNRKYYQSILDELHRIEKDYGKFPPISPALHNLAEMATAMLDNRATSAQDRRRLTHQDNPLDVWRAEFTIEHRVIPNLGFKFSNGPANKGVITYLAEPEEMPRDADGNVADIALGPNAPINRQTVSLPMEVYFGSVNLKVSRHVRELLGIDFGDPNPGAKLRKLIEEDPDRFDEAWNYLLKYYELMSPNRHLKILLSQRWRDLGGSPLTYMTEMLKKEHVGVYSPPENDRNFKWAIKEIQNNPELADIKPCYGPVTYVDYTGELQETIEPIRIGPVHYIMLEKITDDGSAVASSKTQLHGFLAQTTNRDKYNHPLKMNPTRVGSETDVRNITAFAGQRAIAELMDRNNSVESRREGQRKIMSSDKPTQIPVLIDRKKFGYGGSKPLQIFKNVSMAGGYEMVYRPYRDDAIDAQDQDQHAQD